MTESFPPGAHDPPEPLPHDESHLEPIRPPRVYVPEGNSEGIKGYHDTLMHQHTAIGYDVVIGEGVHTEGLDGEEKKQAIKDGASDSMQRVASGEFDAVALGAKTPTKYVLEAAIKTFGAYKYRPETDAFDDEHGQRPEEVPHASTSMRFEKPGEKTFVAGDCGSNPMPNKEQLYWSTLQTIKTAVELGLKPTVAFISYSTGDSGVSKNGAKNTFIDNEKYAIERLQREHPEIQVMPVPVQWDTAEDPDVYKEKTGQPYPFDDGQPSVYMFSNLDTGNTVYKVLESKGRGGGFSAVGPIIQGIEGDPTVIDMSRNTNEDPGKVSAIVGAAGMMATQKLVAEQRKQHEQQPAEVA